MADHGAPHSDFRHDFPTRAAQDSAVDPRDPRMDAAEITSSLRAWHSGDPSARDRVFEIVYDTLRRIAGDLMRRERASHTLQPTALVNEAMLRLIGAPADYKDRAHFFAFAAQAMRRVLVEHARAVRALKRGGGVPRAPLDLAGDVAVAADDTVLELDRGLEALAQVAPRTARALELHYFAGMSYDEVADALEVSPATIDRELRFGKSWLKTELAP